MHWVQLTFCRAAVSLLLQLPASLDVSRWLCKLCGVPWAKPPKYPNPACTPGFHTTGKMCSLIWKKDYKVHRRYRTLHKHADYVFFSVHKLLTVFFLPYLFVILQHSPVIWLVPTYVSAVVSLTIFHPYLDLLYHLPHWTPQKMSLAYFLELPLCILLCSYDLLVIFLHNFISCINHSFYILSHNYHNECRLLQLWKNNAFKYSSQTKEEKWTSSPQPPPPWEILLSTVLDSLPTRGPYNN